MMDTNTKKSEKMTFSNGSVYEGDFVDGQVMGIGKLTWPDGNFYEGGFIDGVRSGRGKLTMVNEETREPLYTEIYDENGIMESVEYLFENEGNHFKMDINYNGINETGNLEENITIYDEDNNIIEDYDTIIQLVKQCTKYQMQGKLKGRDGNLDNESRMRGGHTGLQNLVILSETADNVETLSKIRFLIEQNSIDWPTSTYDDIESFLKRLGLTTRNPPENDRLTYIGTLLEKGIDYICVNMVTTAKNHVVSGTIDLKKLIQLLQLEKERKLRKLSKKKLEELMNFIYIYDSSRAISLFPDKVGDLGNLQKYCKFYNHKQQKPGLCWYHSCCSNIVMAEHPEIVSKIREHEIVSVKKPSFFARFLGKIGIIKNIPEINYLETLQILKLQKVAKHFGVERFGKDNKRMIHQVVLEPTREAIKIWANNYFREHENLNCLENRLNAYESLLVIGYNEGLGVNELGPKARQILSERTGAINEGRILANEDEVVQPKKGGIFNKILVGLMRTFRIFRKSSILKNEELNKNLVEANKESTIFEKATERNQILLDEENKQLNLPIHDLDEGTSRRTNRRILE